MLRRLIHACMCRFYTLLITVVNLYSLSVQFFVLTQKQQTTSHFFGKYMCSIYSCAILIIVSVVLRTNGCKMERHPALIVGMHLYRGGVKL